MPEIRCASLLMLLVAGTAQAAEPGLVGKIEQAARAQLARQAEASALAEPEFTITVVNPRAAPACRQPVSVEPVDTRSAARMRFAVQCRDTPGWRYEYIVRAKVSAKVAVTAGPVAAGQLLSDDDLVIERRDISSLSDTIGVAAAVGQASRRSLRAGEVLRQSQLAAPILVKRGEPVVMLARVDAIEVSTAGEALDSGAQGSVVRVRNVANGRVVRMRVTAAGTVEPVEVALTR
ncbi:flagellar basal body P-ring formation chaperone FlgA [Massilia sp. GCM10020059]|uniref:Flagella basal body P-ring formation protein FlgA n=1 Tax=Massilia agrisoli TaxID=2892444 RepID=A0ABS8IPR0_9BURK|nr:flagellar basal body P-ring formation chaperone FlgA [Massilia agrisoli]MCC6069931.1 flagellar basal body P-ring formation chaperone FlgA [Massilia agrisoli]